MIWDTITEMELGIDGRVVALKGKCKARDLKRRM